MNIEKAAAIGQQSEAIVRGALGPYLPSICKAHLLELSAMIVQYAAYCKAAGSPLLIKFGCKDIFSEAIGTLNATCERMHLTGPF